MSKSKEKKDLNQPYFHDVSKSTHRFEVEVKNNPYAEKSVILVDFDEVKGTAAFVIETKYKHKEKPTVYTFTLTKYGWEGLLDAISLLKYGGYKMFPKMKQKEYFVANWRER